MAPPTDADIRGRYELVRAPLLDYLALRDKTSLVMSTRNIPGAIHELLTPLARCGVSMTRLESRPSRTGLWEYVFFVDLEGHQTEDKVARALDEMRGIAAFLKILGSFPVAAQ